MVKKYQIFYYQVTTRKYKIGVNNKLLIQQNRNDLIYLRFILILKIVRCIR